MYVINLKKKIRYINKQDNELLMEDFAYDKLHCDNLENLINDIKKSINVIDKGNKECKKYEDDTDGLRGTKHYLKMCVFLNNKPLMNLKFSNYENILGELLIYNDISDTYIGWDNSSFWDVHTEYQIYLKPKKEIVFGENGSYSD